MAKQYGFESEEDFLRMQQEAIRRVREMQNRARATLEKAGMHIENSDTERFPEQRQAGGSRQDLSPRAFSQRNNYGPAGGEPSQQKDSSRSRADGGTYKNRPDSGGPHENSLRSESSSGALQGGLYPRGGGPYADDWSGCARQTPNPPEAAGPAMRLPGLNLSLDSDQLLLLLTIYLLIKDGADRWLILALAYIML